MPLPLIVGGIAAAAGVAGIVSGAKGAKKISDAKSRVKAADEKYEAAKKKLEVTEKGTTEALDKLGALKVTVWKDFEYFSTAFEKIQNRPEFETKLGDKFELPKHALAEIKEVEIKAIEILGTTVASAGAGAVTGMAAYSGVLALGTASTGTAISTLSGAAATKAALAALGGGSIASGGGGIALGTQILGGAVAGPVIAVGGLLLNAKGNSSLEKAQEAENEVNKILPLLEKSTKFLTDLSALSNRFKNGLTPIHQTYLKEVVLLEKIVEKEKDYNKYSLEEKTIVDNNIKLVGVLYKLSMQDLVKPSNNKSDLPQLLTWTVDNLVKESEKKVAELIN